MKKIPYILFAFLFIVSCSNPKKQMTSKVKGLETELEKGFSKQKADELTVDYNTYIEKYPKDSTARLYMAKGVELSILNNDPTSALKFVDQFLANFPNDSKAPLMQFKKGMIYDLLLHDGLRAVAEYNIFIQNYPNDPMRADAENAILLLQDPEAFLKTLGNTTDSTSKVPNNQ